MTTRFTIAAATAALVSLTFGSSAHAQETDGARSTRVYYGDLNMSSRQGRVVLMHRVKSAARRVCSEDQGMTDFYTRIANVACAKRAMSEAQKALAARTGVTIAAR